MCARVNYTSQRLSIDENCSNYGSWINSRCPWTVIGGLGLNYVLDYLLSSLHHTL